ncbi:MAG: TolC family protein [Myxococcota bacterium]|nr:TolC family protein [Myxococcota bacterium]
MTRARMSLTTAALALAIVPTTAWGQVREEGTKENETRASATELGLDVAIERAEQQNETWQITEQRITQARARVEQARTAFYPTVQAGASVTRNPSAVELNGRVILPVYSWEASAGAGITLFDGTRMPEVARANASMESERARAEWQRATIQFEVASAWYTLAATQAQIELLEEILVLREQDVERAEALVRGERAVPLDVSRARADLLATQQQRLDAIAARQDAADALAVLLGQEADGALLASGGVEALETPATLPAQDVSLEERADFQATARAIDAAAQAEEAQSRRWWPTVDLGANALIGPPALTRPNGYFWSITLSANWVIYDGGLRRLQLDELSSRTEELRLQQSLVLRQERAELVRIRRQIELARASEEVIDARVKNSEEALRLAKLRFAAGTASSIEIRDATSALLDARSAHILNRLNIKLALARYDYLSRL